MRQAAGVLLVGLALLKAVGLIAVLVRGDGDPSTQWLVKQSVYAVAAASVGWSLLRNNTSDDASPPT